MQTVFPIEAAVARPARNRLQSINPGLLAAGCLASLLVLLPLAVTLVSAASTGWQVASALLLRPLVGELLINTLLLIACTVGLTGLIGTAAAWAVERTDLPGKKFWAVLMVVPLAIPPFITSYAWVSLDPALENFAGALLVVTVSYMPLVYLPVAAALREMDPALEETARALGNRTGGVFLRVVLPQLRPALLGGMLLVALNVLVEFGAFALLRFRTFTTAIYSAYRAGFSGAEPALLSTILLFLCIACLAAEALVRGKARYGRLARGTRRKAARYALGRWKILPVLGFSLLALLTIGVPLGMILYWLTQSAEAATTVAAYSLDALLQTGWASIRLGVFGAALTLVLAVPLGILSARYDFWLITLLERSAYLAQSIPGIVVALALVSLTVHSLQPLYQSTALLVIAYAIMFLPLALVSVRTAFGQAQRRLEEAGRSLGLNRIQVLIRISLPLAAPGLGAAASMVFIATVTELTATLLLAPIGTQTLATEIWANTSTLAFAAASPYAAALAVLSMAASWLLARRFGAATVYRTVT
jgi:iron(III) transport system permease protein